ncbi:NERD domain-containing protein [Salirhabdus sp. Marseille-P4669]|uniref:NERD domain-containing protein n=1 Tax=Salirhabdus sp. Marseille-P4669 TaxID=2042310 RepID=UPI0013578992|nr:NERD domain-containing protein [Salirhabdus sp. Marseille-P4669]
MIKHDGSTPLIIRMLEALLRRLHPNHNKRPKIVEEYNNRLSGYRGEQSLNFHISFLNKEYFVFKDLRLPDSEGRFFQMDLLILTSKFIIIMEVKSHRGTLIFDQQSSQLIREWDSDRTAYSDPVIQARRQKNQLQSFLTKHKLPHAPIETLVIISNPSTIIKVEPFNHPNSKMIVRAEAIPFKVEEIEKKHRKEHLTTKELQKISRVLLKLNTPHHTNVLQKFQLTESEILPGVHCPSCSQLAMIRIKGYWYCNKCNFKSKEAHLSTLEDYALLFHKAMTNRDCRHFLQIPSKDIASNILRSLQVKRGGSYKNRKYEVQEIINNK